MFYNLHTHRFTNNSEITELVNQYPWEFVAGISQYSIGIHPWYIVENRLESDLQFMEQKLQLPECWALGECGLDKRIDIPMALQTEVFEKQIALAEKYQKPLVLHLVAAYQELIAIHKKRPIKVPVILHGFSKNEQTAKSLMDCGFYLSFGKYLLRNPELATVFQSVPNDRFFLETDTLEETLMEVYDKASLIKALSLTELKNQVALNWRKVFKS
jgi:TatD DNase family protein